MPKVATHALNNNARFSFGIAEASHLHHDIDFHAISRAHLIRVLVSLLLDRIIFLWVRYPSPALQRFFGRDRFFIRVRVEADSQLRNSPIGISSTRPSKSTRSAEAR